MSQEIMRVLIEKMTFFVDFSITDLKVVGNGNNDNGNKIDFTITSSELVEGNYPTVNRETEPFFYFTITDSTSTDSKNGKETINVTINDDAEIPNANMIESNSVPPKRKKNNYLSSNSSCSSS